MWVEMQPFGYPGKPWDAHHHHAEGCSCDEHCCDYAMRRNKHIRDYKLQWCLLKEHENVSSSSTGSQNLHILADKIWWKLHRQQIQDLPHLGKDSSDFKSFQEVLQQGTCMSAGDAHFACAPTRSLHDRLPSSTAGRCSRGEISNWQPAMRFGQLLLPCATAEVSSQADKAVTRLCLPFIDASGGRLDPEDAIASLCSLAWFLAFLLERDLVETGRVWRVSHKGGSTKEDDDLWFNKPCTCGRLATAIEDGNNTMLYMYIGGSAVYHKQSYLLGSLVVSCKSWRWAALLYAAARVATLASNNSLGPLNSHLMRPMDEDERDSTTETVCSFQQVCESMWGRVRETCNDLLYELEEEWCTDKSMRSVQSQGVGEQLASLFDAHAADVIDLLSVET